MEINKMWAINSPVHRLYQIISVGTWSTLLRLHITRIVNWNSASFLFPAKSLVDFPAIGNKTTKNRQMGREIFILFDWVWHVSARDEPGWSALTENPHVGTLFSGFAATWLQLGTCVRLVFAARPARWTFKTSTGPFRSCTASCFTWK